MDKDEDKAPTEPLSPDKETTDLSAASPTDNKTPTDQVFAAGEKLAERYVVKRFIARGGMGSVYEAEDLELGVAVALKTILPDRVADSAALERFKREIRLARRVTHPHVCRIFDLGHHREPGREVTFLTMELLAGESLWSRIRHRGRLPQAEARLIVEQMVSALETAHKEGIVHRDFKSQNVMLVPRSDGERVFVTDFGLALEAAPEGEEAARITAEGRIVGTAAYMAPEQVQGKDIGPAADIYALGIVMFEMVTGKLPFRGDSAMSTAAKRLVEEPPLPRGLVPDLDPLWETVILRCLQREPADRYAEVGLVTRALSAQLPPTQQLRSDDQSLRANVRGSVAAVSEESAGTSSSAGSAVIRTLLVTDLVGSTKLMEALGDEQASVVFARHDRLARDLLSRHEGQEIDKTDGILCLFERPAQAVDYAMAYHRGLAGLAGELGAALAARVGIHLGEVRLRHNTPEDIARGAKRVEVQGLAKPLVSRLMSLAVGGQTLLSRGAYELAHRSRTECNASLPEVHWLSHGHYQFKGIGEPVEVYEVGPEGRAPLQAPPESDMAHPVVVDASGVHPVEELPHNLPEPLTSFVGRERETEEVRQLLSGSRLVTLTGAGGCGKSRLGLELATRERARHRDGTWLVELAALADPLLVPQAVATVLGVKEEPGRPIGETLVDYLQPRETLLLLDNCEHLTEAVAPLVYGLLKSCAKLRMLTTSREPLSVAGEATYRVPSLALPGAEAVTPEDMSRSEAVRFFVERARAANPRFELKQDNAAAVAQICSQLDGIPLALELAAARVKALAVAQILKRLDDRFRLLRSASRTALPRHQTLRAAIDWSYEHLADNERVLLRRLSVFAGGFALEAAETVTPGGDLDELDVLDRLSDLVDKSLVVFEEQGDEGRYRLLKTVQQYGHERLEEARESEEVRGRHLDFYLQRAEEAEPELAGAEQAEWLDRLETEHDNLRAALGQSVRAEGDGEKGLRLARALGQFWEVRGYFDEGRRVLARLLAPDDAPIASRAAALHAAGQLAMRQGDYAEARESLEKSLAARLELEDRGGVASSLQSLGIMAHEQGDYQEARRLYEECLAIRRELEDRSGCAHTLLTLGNIAARQGDYPRAHALFDESLAIRRELGDKRGIAQALHNLGNTALYQGDHAQARGLYEEGLAIRRELRDRRGEALTLRSLSNIALYHQGDPAQARRLCEESLAIRHELKDRRGVALTLGNLGDIGLGEGNLAEARKLYEESLVIRRELKDKRGVAQTLNNLGDVAFYQADRATARQLYEESLAMRRELQDKRGVAQSLHNLGNTRLHEGDLDTARELCEESLALSSELHDRLLEAQTLLNVGTIASIKSHCDEARASYRKSLAIMSELGDERSTVEGLEAFAHLAMSLGEAGRAVRLYAAVEARREPTGNPRAPEAREQTESGVAASRASLGEEAFAAAWAEGRGMSLEQAVAFALAT